MNNEKPLYLLSDEEVELYDDVDMDPYADDVAEELDFDEVFEREYEPELTIQGYEDTDAAEEEEEADRILAHADQEEARDNHPIDNMRW